MGDARAMSDGRRDLARDAEHLRRWLDDLAAVPDAAAPPGLADWRRAHAAAVIAAALALEELAAAPPRSGWA